MVRKWNFDRKSPFLRQELAGRSVLRGLSYGGIRMERPREEVMPPALEWKPEWDEESCFVENGARRPLRQTGAAEIESGVRKPRGTSACQGGELGMAEETTYSRGIRQACLKEMDRDPPCADRGRCRRSTAARKGPRGAEKFGWERGDRTAHQRSQSRSWARRWEWG